MSLKRDKFTLIHFNPQSPILNHICTRIWSRCGVVNGWGSTMTDTLCCGLFPRPDVSEEGCSRAEPEERALPLPGEVSDSSAPMKATECVCTLSHSSVRHILSRARGMPRQTGVWRLCSLWAEQKELEIIDILSLMFTTPAGRWFRLKLLRAANLQRSMSQDGESLQSCWYLCIHHVQLFKP